MRHSWALVLLGLAGCAIDDSSVPVDGTTFVVTTDPTMALHRGSNRFLITVRTLDGAEVTGARVEVRASMPAHAHDAPTATVQEAERGTYRVEGLVLSMPGIWHLRVAATAAGRTDGKTFRFDVP